MSVALAEAWTVERFLDWVVTQEDRYEFDGIAPVAMNGSTANHNIIALNLHAVLRSRLRGTGYQVFGLEAGLQAGRSVRYPDALVTGTRQAGTARIITDVCAAFEVLSPSTARTDRFIKAREYAAVPSVLRYALIESRFPGITALHRANGADPWTSLPLGLEDLFSFPEAGIEFPVAELYEDIDFPSDGDVG